jgi:glycosyltransferase involved in cell wall biosynthesis
MFAYHFPPENVIGAARPFRFAKYLSELGYRCKVYTAVKQTTRSVVDAEYIPDTFLTPSRTAVHWQCERAIRQFFYPGATGFRWSRLASKAAAKFIRSNINSEITVFSTFPPLGAHLAALSLKRKTGLRWVADFRDPLSIVPGHIGLSRFQHWMHDWLQRAILKNADAIIVNTDSLADEWNKKYKQCRDKIHLIWNGFDPSDHVEEVSIPKRSRRILAHIGALYGGRTVRPLLESVSRIIDEGRVPNGAIQIRLVGHISDECLPNAAFLKRAINQGWLELIPNHLPQAEARRIGQESDGLLLVQPHTTTQVPGKLFEYVRLKRPILAFVPRQTPTERILQQSGLAFDCVYTDASFEEIDNTMASFLNRENTTTQSNAWFEENFNGQKQAQQLAVLIDLNR